MNADKRIGFSGFTRSDTAYDGPAESRRTYEDQDAKKDSALVILEAMLKTGLIQYTGE